MVTGVDDLETARTALRHGALDYVVKPFRANDVLISLAPMLAGAGYGVEEAENPALALELCAHGDKRVDLVLTDVVLPSMSGIELAERLAEVRPDVAVLFMSGHANQVSQGVEGDRPFLHKPFTPEQLLDSVHKLTRGAAAGGERTDET